MTQKSTSTTIELLTPIWERVLQCSPIGLQDDFFSLGGDSVSAVALFSEIAQACGRQLPPVMIYHAPTIHALAAQLDQTAASPFPSILPMKTGGEGSPVFIAHGLGGSVIDFFQLVRHIDSQLPIYGLQARGIDGVDEPFDRIEDLAEFYLDGIRKVQPHGPYFLIGYSLGGLVALEMAQRLSQQGERVALLAMVESYPYVRFLPLKERLRLVTRRAKHYASHVIRLPFREALSYTLLPSNRRFYLSWNVNGSSPERLPTGELVTPTLQRARDRAYLALTRYRPRFYQGKIKFVMAQIVSNFPDNPVAVWSGLAKEFDVESVPGDHLGIIATYSETLAAVLSRYLKEASC